MVKDVASELTTAQTEDSKVELSIFESMGTVGVVSPAVVERKSDDLGARLLPLSNW